MSGRNPPPAPPNRPLLLKRFGQFRSVRHRQPHWLAVIAGNLDEWNAALAAIELDHFLLAVRVFFDVDIVVSDAGPVQITKRSPRVSTPICSVNRYPFRHGCLPAPVIC